MTPAVGLLAAAAALLVAGGRTGAARLAGIACPGPAGPPVGARAVARSGAARVGVGATAVAGLLWAAVGGAAGAVTGLLVGAAIVLAARRLTGPAVSRAGTGDLAAAWDLLAVCLRSGLAVPVAVEAAAARLPGAAGRTLRRTSGLLELGADAREAWAGTASVPELATFGRAAARSAATGAALGRTAEAEATRLRSELADRAEAEAQRATVRITAPLGLCFLPAFLVLGIAPVVIGLAGEVLARW